MSISVFDNPVASHCVHLTLERDPTTLMHVLELFSMRGVLPLRAEFDAFAGDGGTGRLMLQARMGTHDWKVLCARAATLVGVVSVSAGTPPGEFGPVPRHVSSRSLSMA